MPTGLGRNEGFKMKNIIFAITALFLSSTFAYAGRFAEDSSLSSGIQNEDSHNGAHKGKKYALDGDRKGHEGKRYARDDDRKRHEGRKYARDDDRKRHEGRKYARDDDRKRHEGRKYALDDDREDHGRGEHDSHDRDHEVSPH